MTHARNISKGSPIHRRDEMSQWYFCALSETQQHINVACSHPPLTELRRSHRRHEDEFFLEYWHQHLPTDQRWITPIMEYVEEHLWDNTDLGGDIWNNGRWTPSVIEGFLPISLGLCMLNQLSNGFNASLFLLLRNILLLSFCGILLNYSAYNYKTNQFQLTVPKNLAQQCSAVRAIYRRSLCYMCDMSIVHNVWYIYTCLRDTCVRHTPGDYFHCLRLFYLGSHSCDVCGLSFDVHYLFVFSGMDSSSIALLRVVDVCLPLLAVSSGKADIPIVQIVSVNIFQRPEEIYLNIFWLNFELNIFIFLHFVKLIYLNIFAIYSIFS